MTSQNQTANPIDLAELSFRLDRIDHHLISLLSKRLETAKQIEELKRDAHQPIVRSDKEKGRLADAGKWALQYGLNPDFVRSLMYLLISEAFKVQFEQFQSVPVEPPVLSFDQMRQNLLDLTEVVAASYEYRFDEHFFATREYRRYENEIISATVLDLDDRCLALDLGCATGIQALQLADDFDKVWGCDVSGSMIAVAIEKIAKSPYPERIQLEVADLDKGVRREDASASLVVMNIGTGSEVHNIGHTLREISRVLKPRGKAILSFYNEQALAYKGDFIPWPLSLAAGMNPRLNCLEVHAGNKVYQVFARAYRIDEIRRELPPDLRETEFQTYPTISSILPDDLFDDKGGIVERTIQEIDGDLSRHGNGNYIILVCEKT
jgi:ubiquinone/menaquinone biosynthesis C-methylase UbiE/chorismate mutase